MSAKRSVHHLYKEDVVQLIFGAFAFGIPAAYTQEAWDLGAMLHPLNYLFLLLLSLLIIALAVFHTGYHIHTLRTFERLYLKRVISSYIVIILTCAIFLTLINRAPWFSEPFIALQRAIVIGVPATISGITADLIK